MATSGSKKGGVKTGGRKPGSLNRKTISFRETMDKMDFDVAEECIKLFRSWELPPNLQLQLLEMIASYSHSKPKPLEGPESQLTRIPSMSDDHAIRLVTAPPEDDDGLNVDALDGVADE